MLQALKGLKKGETLVKIPVTRLGLGHATRWDPNRYEPGHSHRTYDVDLDTMGSIKQRRGIRFLSDHGIGGSQLATGSEGAGWTGVGQTLEEAISDTAQDGGPSDITLALADPAINHDQHVGREVVLTSGTGAGQSGRIVTAFNVATKVATVTPAWAVEPAAGTGYTLKPVIRPFGFAGPLSKARRIHGAAVVNARFTQAFNLGNDLEEFIVASLWVHDKTKINWGGNGVGVNFETTANVDFWSFRLVQADVKDFVNDGIGWNLLVRRKKDFTAKAGNPSWTNINSIDVKVGPSALTSVIVTDIWYGARQVDGLFNFRQSESKGGGNFLIGAARGILAYFNDTERRWVPLATDLTPYTPVAFATFTDFCYAAWGGRPKVIVGDGAGGLSAATTFNAGIDNPGISGTMAAVSGVGVLPTGIHEYRFEFFSDFTGLPGASGLDNFLAVPATAADVKIALSGLPVSTDPKVTKLRIYRRDATMQFFRRVVELANGTTNYEDNTASLDLGAELPGFPQYIANGPPPKLAFMAVVGSRMIAAGDPDNTGILYASKQGNAEQWDLANAPTRLDQDDNDPISAVWDHYGFAAAGKERAVYVGSALAIPSGFSYVKRASNAGPVCHRAVIVLPDGARYRSHDGYYQMGRDFNPYKIMREWAAQAASAPGVIEPSFDQFDGRMAQRICGAYFKDKAQIFWNEKLLSEANPTLLSVCHVGHLEGERPEAQGAVDGWSFHRPAKGNTLAGFTALANYIEDSTGRHKVMGGGPCGFVYEVQTDEFDDVLPTGRVLINGDILFAFMVHPGVALGSHQLKDYVYHDIVMVPLGHWAFNLEYFYDWLYNPTTKQIETGGSDPFGDAALPFQVGPVYAELGTYLKVKLPARRSRNIAWRLQNNTLGQSFHLSECTWFLEYLGGDGAE